MVPIRTKADIKIPSHDNAAEVRILDSILFTKVLEPSGTGRRDKRGLAHFLRSPPVILSECIRKRFHTLGLYAVIHAPLGLALTCPDRQPPVASASSESSFTYRTDVPPVSVL